MNFSNPQSNDIEKYIGALAPNNLYAYDSTDIGKGLVGLKLRLQHEFPYPYFIPLNMLSRLANTCKELRSKLTELNLDHEAPQHQTLSEIVQHILSSFSREFHLNSYQIEQMQFQQKTYELLHTLDLRGHNSITTGFYYGDSEEQKSCEENYRNSLLAFVSDNPAEVVKLVFHWAQAGEGHREPIGHHEQTLITIFQTLEGGEL